MKKTWLFIVALVFSMVLTACGGSQESSEGATKGKKKTLVVYTNSASDGRGDWLKEKAVERGFEIEFVEAGGGEIRNKLIAEKANPIADVVYGLNEMNYIALKNEDVLEPFTPVWAEEVEEGTSDPEGYYHSLVKQAILLIYNSELYTEETAASDWSELWQNKAFHGLYEVPTNLGGDTTRTVIAGILVRHQDPNGELGISEEGWEEIKEFFDNGSPASEGTPFYANLANGTTPFGQMFSSGVQQREEEYGVKAGIVSPEIGVPYVTEQVAIVKGTEKKEVAEEFINWFGSSEVQAEWAKEFNSMPTNIEAAKSANPEVKALHESVKKQDIEWDFITENIDAWIEKITLEIQ